MFDVRVWLEDISNFQLAIFGERLYEGDFRVWFKTIRIHIHNVDRVTSLVNGDSKH